MESKPYLCFRELLSPTGIDHALFFKSMNEQNLISLYLMTASVNTISIYQVADENDYLSANYRAHGGLTLVFKDCCYGRIQSMKSFKSHDSPSERLVLSFDSAKFVTVYFDASNKALVLISLLNIEENAIGVGASEQLAFRFRSNAVGIGPVPILATENHANIAASIIYGQYLLFFNLKATIDNDSKTTVHFVTDLKTSLQLIGPILDICFVSGYGLPCLAVLMDSGQVPFGHIAKVRYTCTLAVLTVDMAHKTVSLLWKQSGMPHDSFKILQAVKPVDGGILVISMNGILHVTSSEVISVGVNSFALASVHPTHKIVASDLELGYELDQSNWAATGDSECVGFLKDGTMMSLRLQVPLSSGSSNGHLSPKQIISLKVIGISVQSSCVSVFQDLWFIGSKLNDAILLSAIKEVSRSQIQLTTPIKRDLYDNISILSTGSSLSAAASNKRQRRLSRQIPESKSQEFSVFEAEMEAEERLLYGTAIHSDSIYPNALDRGLDYVIEVLYSIPVVPAIQSGTFSKADDIYDQIDSIDWEGFKGSSYSVSSKQTPSSYIAEFESKDYLLINAGVNSSSAIFRVSNGLKMTKLASRNYGGVQRILTVTYPNLQYLLLFLSYSTSTKVCRLSYEESIRENEQLDGNSSESSKILGDGQLVSKELLSEVSGCHVSSQTIAVGMASEDALIQIFEKGIRLVKLCNGLNNQENEALQDMMLHESEELGGLEGDLHDVIVDGCVSGQYAIAITKMQRLYLVSYDSREDILVLQASRYPLSNDENSMSDNEHIWNICPVSASVYVGLEDFSPPESQLITKQSLDLVLTPSELEEKFLYGERLSKFNDHDNDASSESKVTEFRNETNRNGQSPSQNQLHSYIVIVDKTGVFWLFDMNLTPVMSINNLNEKLDCIYPEWTIDATKPNEIAPLNKLASAKLVSLGSSDLKSPKTLCLIGVLSTGDLIVYTAQMSNRKVHKFSKISHSHQLNSRNAVTGKRLGKSSNQLFGAATQTWKITLVPDINGQSVVVVSGANPAIIIAPPSSVDTPVITVSNLGLPELPFSNNGNLAIESLVISNKIRGFVSLWVEKFEEQSNPLGGTFSKQQIYQLQQQQQSLVGFYQEVSSIQLPGTGSGLITVNRISTGNTTIHRMLEISKSRVEDKTELQLLEKKLLLASCSQSVNVPFRPDVLTETEVAKMEADFAYYFSDLTSWFQPNDPSSLSDVQISAESNHLKQLTGISLLSGKSTAWHSGVQLPTPNLIDRHDKVVLLQGGTVVDEYFLGENERILDIEVSYVAVAPPAPISTFDRRRQPQMPVSVSQPLRKTIMLVGTCLADKHGEDCPSDGRLLLFSLDYTKQTSDAIPASKEVLQPKLKLTSVSVGPASIIRQFSKDRIISTMGPALAIYRFVAEANPATPGVTSSIVLDQISFYYAKFYITSVTIVKNFIFIADAANRIELLVWRDEDWSLTLLSKEYSRVTMARAISSIHDGNSLATIAGDDEANIQLLQFDPMREVESIQGSKLLCLADFHVGSEISVSIAHSALSHQLHESSDDQKVPVRGLISRPGQTQVFGTRLLKSSNQKSCVLAGTMDGSIGVFVPVNERVFKRLNLLQHLISMTLQSTCALNPKEYRTFKSSRFRFEVKKGILDGTILWKYVSLSTSVQSDLAAAMGTTVDTILDNLYELNMLTQFF